MTSATLTSGADGAGAFECAESEHPARTAITPSAAPGKMNLLLRENSNVVLAVLRLCGFINGLNRLIEYFLEIAILRALVDPHIGLQLSAQFTCSNRCMGRKVRYFQIVGILVKLDDRDCP